MFNRKTPEKAPPRELTPWELAQQNSPTSRVEETVPKEDVRFPKREPKPKKKIGRIESRNVSVFSEDGSVGNCLLPVRL